MSCSSDDGLAPAPKNPVRRAQRFLEIVDRIAAANATRIAEMTERYFRRMVLREAEQQLAFEEYLETPQPVKPARH